MIIMGVYMVLLMGFRYRVGMDTMIYMKKMQYIPPIDELVHQNIFKQVYEPSYLIICSICKYFTNEFWPIQLVMNAITTTCVFIFLYKNCKNVFAGIFIFLLLQWLYYSTEVMRESVAIGFFLLNYQNYKEKKWLKYYLFSIFSLSFHYSALLIWFLPLARYLKFNIPYIVLCFGMLGVMPLIEDFNKLVHLGMVSDKINTYIDQTESLNLNWRIGEMIKSGFPALMTLIVYKLSHKENRYSSFVLLQFMLCCGAFAVPIIFQRFANYTSMFVTISIANYITFKDIRFLARGSVVGLLCLSQSFYYYTMFPTWFPYVSVFNAEKVKEREEFFRIVW